MDAQWRAYKKASRFDCLGIYSITNKNQEMDCQRKKGKQEEVMKWVKSKIVATSNWLVTAWHHGIIITNSSIPKYSSWFINVYAITIWPFIFIKDDGNPKTVRHEKIHIRQQREFFLLGVIFFYIFYVLFWFFHLIRLRNSQLAYYAIPFEREAYQNDDDESYLENRKWFSWTKYIRETDPEESILS